MMMMNKTEVEKTRHEGPKIVSYKNKVLDEIPRDIWRCPPSRQHRWPLEVASWTEWSGRTSRWCRERRAFVTPGSSSPSCRSPLRQVSFEPSPFSRLRTISRFRAVGCWGASLCARETTSEWNRIPTSRKLNKIRFELLSRRKTTRQNYQPNSNFVNIISGVAMGEMGGSRPPTSVQTPLEISANPLKTFFYIWGYIPHVCIL